MPAAQAVQVEAPLPVNVLVTEPASQLLQATRSAEEYLPASQLLHDVAADPCWYVPSAHRLHPISSTDLSFSENLPGPQGSQSLSNVLAYPASHMQAPFMHFV